MAINPIRREIVPTPGIQLVPHLEDIESLNQRAVLGEPERLEITKLSVSALAHCTDRYSALASGAAVGRGVGPLVVRHSGRTDIEQLSDLAGVRAADRAPPTGLLCSTWHSSP